MSETNDVVGGLRHEGAASGIGRPFKAAPPTFGACDRVKCIQEVLIEMALVGTLSGPDVNGGDLCCVRYCCVPNYHAAIVRHPQLGMSVRSATDR